MFKWDPVFAWERSYQDLNRRSAGKCALIAAGNCAIRSGFSLFRLV